MIPDEATGGCHLTCKKSLSLGLNSLTLWYQKIQPEAVIIVNLVFLSTQMYLHYLDISHPNWIPFCNPRPARLFCSNLILHDSILKKSIRRMNVVRHSPTTKSCSSRLWLTGNDEIGRRLPYCKSLSQPKSSNKQPEVVIIYVVWSTVYFGPLSASVCSATP